MTTGSHVLDAFNLDYDSYTDNVVFAACIDRVGEVPAHDAEGVRVQSPWPTACRPCCARRRSTSPPA